MNRSTIERAVAAVALVATLSLVAPSAAQAAVWSSGGRAASVWAGGWGWLSSLWDKVTMLVGAGRNPVPHAGAALAKDGAATSTAAGSGGGGGASPSDDTRPTINPDGGA